MDYNTIGVILQDAFIPNSSTHLKLSNIKEKKFHKLFNWQDMIEVILLLNRFVINIIFNMH